MVGANTERDPLARGRRAVVEGQTEVGRVSGLADQSHRGVARHGRGQLWHGGRGDLEVRRRGQRAVQNPHRMREGDVDIVVVEHARCELGGLPRRVGRGQPAQFRQAGYRDRPGAARVPDELVHAAPRRAEAGAVLGLRSELTRLAHRI
eukprot:scaffold30513_cov123-Isochrysis_galbana.AAC.6